MKKSEKRSEERRVGKECVSGVQTCALPIYQIAKMYQIAVQEVIKAYEELRSEQNNERNV